MNKLKLGEYGIFYLTLVINEQFTSIALWQSMFGNSFFGQWIVVVGNGNIRGRNHRGMIFCAAKLANTMAEHALFPNGKVGSYVS